MVLRVGQKGRRHRLPYRRYGELVNVKHRAIGEKAFAQVKNAETIVYALDDIADEQTADREPRYRERCENLSG